MELYNLPYRQESGFKWSTTLLFLFSFLFTVAVAVVFFVMIRKDDPLFGILFGCFMLISSLFFGYILVWFQVLHKAYIELTDEQFKVSLPFGTKAARWDEISEVYSYNFNGNNLIGILLNRDKRRKTKRSFTNSFNSMYGVPPYSFQVSTRLFSGVEIDRLLSTIKAQIEKSQKATVDGICYYSEDDSHGENNLPMAFATGLILTCVFGLLYGVSLDKLQQNLAPIPIFASFAIIAMFNKYYLESSFNIYLRVCLGLLCFVQIPIAFVTQMFLESKLPLTASNVYSVARSYYHYTVLFPSEYIIVLVLGGICFGMGALRGRAPFNSKG